MSNARNIAALSTVEVGATADQTKADIDALGINRGRKNLIINGGFDVWQRGTAAITVGGSYAYLADRFKSNGSGTVVSRSTDAPEGFNYSIKTTDTSSTSNPSIRQIVEINTANVLFGKPLTLSFYIKGDGVTDIRYAYIGADSNGTSLNAQSVTSTWTRVSATYTVAEVEALFSSSASTTNLNVVITKTGANNGGQSGSLYTTGWQLEPGSVATDFEHRSYGEELALCQRYYQKIVNTGSSAAHGTTCFQAYSSTRGFMSIALPASLRASPTVTYSGVNARTGTLAIKIISSLSTYGGLQASGLLNLDIRTSTTLNAGSTYSITTEPNGYIAADAEL